MSETAGKHLLLGQYNALRESIRKGVVHRVPTEHVESETRFATAMAFRERIKSFRDSLTGIFSRSYFDVQLVEELKQAARADRPIGLGLGDVRKLKQTNDEYGHIGGDRLLRGVGHSIKNGNNRSSDIPCRTGGDEFGIIYPVITSSNPTEGKLVDQHTPKEDLAIAAIRLLENVHNNPIVLRENEHIQPHLDIGVTLSYRNDTPDSIYERADNASYLAKTLIGQNENKVVIATVTPKGTKYEIANSFKEGQVWFNTISNASELLGKKVK